MIEWFASHSFLEQVFLLSGTVGGIILLFRMILMIRMILTSRVNYPGRFHHEK